MLHVGGDDGQMGFSRKRRVAVGIWPAWTNTERQWSAEQMLEGVQRQPVGMKSAAEDKLGWKRAMKDQ